METYLVDFHFEGQIVVEADNEDDARDIVEGMKEASLFRETFGGVIIDNVDKE